jgi:hypothetical protein
MVIEASTEISKESMRRQAVYGRVRVPESSPQNGDV